MKIVHKSVDISNIVTTIEWSGDVSQASRTLDFNVAVSPTDYFLPTVTLMMGDEVVMLDDNDKEVFRGFVFNKEKSISSSEMSVTCYDGLIYLLKSKGTYNFKDMTPESITNKVADDFGIGIGRLEVGGLLDRIFDAEVIYNIIMTAYTIESEKTGKMFIPRMDKGKLNIILKGSNIAKFKLDSKTNVIDSTYGESIENSINKVKIYDEEGNSQGEVSIDGIPGILQDIYKVEEGVDATVGAKGLLRAMEQTASIEALGDFECVTGNAVILKEPFTGLNGLFYIDSDTHTFDGGQHMMSLGLSFKNMMDSQMNGQDPADIQTVDSGGSSGSDGSSGSGATLVGSGGLYGNTNEAKIWNFFRQQGFSETATAGVMGNLKQESQLDPTRKQSGGGKGRGLLQWSVGERWDQLVRWANSTGKDPWGLQTQLQYIMKELTGDAEDKYNASILNRNYGGISGLKGMSINNSLVAFEKSMERAGTPMMETRRRYANAIYSKYKGSNFKAPANSGSGGGSKIDLLIKHAESMIGFRYSQENRFGSNSADCSSLVGRAMVMAGITNDKFLTTVSIHNDSRFTKISRSQLRRGDIVWESGHMALAIGNNRLVEASYSQMRVVHSVLGGRFDYGYRIKGI